MILPKHHSWMFRSERRVEDNVLNLDNAFGKLVHFLFLFKKDAVAVGVVKNTWEGGRFAIRFNLF